jgi:hypothetical protein
MKVLLTNWAVAIAMLALAGCSTILPRPGGHAFQAPESGTSNFPEVESGAVAAAPEQPLVKIITGTELSADEADVTLRSRDDGPVGGLTCMIERLSLRNAHLGEVVYLLTDMCSYNIISTPEAALHSVSIDLHRLTLRQALEAVCRLNGLWYRVDDQVVTVMTSREYGEEVVVRRNEKMRAFTLRYTNAGDSAKVVESLMGGQVVFNDIGSEEVYGHVEEDKSGGGGSGGSEVPEVIDAEEKTRRQVLEGVRDGKTDALELAERLGKKVPAVITVFKRNNMILARSLDESVLNEIGRIVASLDTPTSQVLLEMTILQVTLGDGFESFFKVDFPGHSHILARTMPSGGSGMGTFQAIFGYSDIQAQMSLFAEQNRINVLATPYLMSANNAKVEFFVGEEVPLRDDVSSKTLYDDEGNPTTTVYEVTINREELGTDIEISSFINEDGTITMDFKAEISTPNLGMVEIPVYDENTHSGQSFPLDGVNRSELTSVLTAVPGQPLAIGGIIREQIEETENKVPWLGDIPGLGFFFKEVADKKTKTETVIILTPHLIAHPRDSWRVGREFLDRRSSHPRILGNQENILDYPVSGGTE